MSPLETFQVAWPPCKHPRAWRMETQVNVKQGSSILEAPTGFIS